jgi:hypothetical protein
MEEREMRQSKSAILIALLGLLATSSASAQMRSTPPVRRAVAATPTAYEYDQYRVPEVTSSPSDAAPGSDYYTEPQAAAAAAPASGDKGDASCTEQSCTSQGSDEKSCGCKCCDWCDLGEPWVLFDDCCLKQRGIAVNGYVDQGFTWNPDSPTDRFNGPLTFNDRANEYQFNQLYLYAEKAVSTEDCWYDVGWRVDALYGTDWRTTPQLGLEIEQDGTRRWNQSQRFYGLALPQFYGQVAIHDLDIKFGRWYTPAGYEVVMSTGNFFYSHLYTHQYGEPFTHTGALATFKYTDQLTLLAGIHEGWDQWDDINDSPSLLAGATWVSSDKKTSLAYVMTFGDEANRLFFTNTQNRYYQSLVLTRQVNDNLKYVAHSDYGVQEDVDGVDQNAEWYSITQYLLYKVNDCLSYGLRYEWFRDDDGFRVFGLGSSEFAAGVPSPMGFVGGGYVGNFQDITLGANYKPNANVLIRPEVRWDWYDGLPSGVNGRPLPWDTGTSASQFTAAVDAIVTF